MPALQSLDQTDFSGGINAVASPHHVRRNQVLRCENFILDEDGSLTTRDGMTTIDHAPETVQAILARGTVALLDGTLIQLAIVQMLDGTQQLMRVMTPVWRTMGTFQTSYRTPSFALWLDHALIAAGYEPPIATDGSSFVPLTGVPLVTPAAPVVASFPELSGVVGSGGTTTYHYQIAATNANGHTAVSPAGITTTGPSVLSINQYNVITWTAVPNATGYLLYRTLGGLNQGLIATLGNVTAFADIGLVGDGKPAPTDNTTVSVIPGARYLVVHKNALWALNTAARTTAYDGPSSLRQSDFGTFENWPISYQAFLDKDNGQQGTGLAVFTVAETGIASDDFLVAYKEFAGYIISGTFGPNGQVPSISRIKSNMGNLAARSIQFLMSEGIQGLMRLTHRGFALFDGLNDHLMSEQVRPYLFGHDDIQGVDWTHINRSVAVQMQNPPLYLCACPLAPSGLLTRLFVFDLIRRNWTICTFPLAFGTLDLLLTGESLPQLVGGEEGGTRVVELFNGAQDDDGIDPVWRVRFLPDGRPGHHQYVHRVLVQLYHLVAQQIITGNFVLGPAASGQQQTKVVRVRVGANARVGSPFRMVTEDVAAFEIGLTGDILWTELSGTGMVGIRSKSVQVRPKPLTRPARV